MTRRLIISVEAERATNGQSLRDRLCGRLSKVRTSEHSYRPSGCDQVWTSLYRRVPVREKSPMARRRTRAKLRAGFNATRIASFPFSSQVAHSETACGTCGKFEVKVFFSALIVPMGNKPFWLYRWPVQVSESFLSVCRAQHDDSVDKMTLPWRLSL